MIPGYRYDFKGFNLLLVFSITYGVIGCDYYLLVEEIWSLYSG
jgi:hypothetical protein